MGAQVHDRLQVHPTTDDPSAGGGPLPDGWRTSGLRDHAQAHPECSHFTIDVTYRVATDPEGQEGRLPTQEDAVVAVSKPTLKLPTATEASKGVRLASMDESSRIGFNDSRTAIAPAATPGSVHRAASTHTSVRLEVVLRPSRMDRHVPGARRRGSRPGTPEPM
jgi:hypothetical protein